MADDDDDTDALDIPEILAFKPIERSHRGGRRSALAALVLIPVFLGAAGWAAWHYFGDLLVVQDGYDVPLVRADPGPVKVRPESPGGMQVPDQDKLVYDRMRGDEKPPEVERLLARPEPPLPPPTAMPPQPATPPTETTPPAPVENLAAAPLRLTPPPPKVAPLAPSTKKVLSAQPPAPAPPPPPPPPPPPKAAAPPPAGGDFQVQLAAVRSPEQARGEWKRLRRKNGDMLGKLRLFITKADLGPEKGVYFRLRAGPLANEVEAKALCVILAERNIACLVVGPKG